jgi:hypothetical protein
LLDWTKRRDYATFACIGLLPLVVAWVTDTARDVPVAPGAAVYESCLALQGPAAFVVGYGSRLNWWPYFAFLPFVLLVIRHTARRLFPLVDGSEAAPRGILRKIAPGGRAAVADQLRFAALDPANLKAVLAIALLINVIDVRELAVHYFGTSTSCPRELDWTVRFLADPSVSRSENLFVVLVAYPSQFIAHSLALMLFGLLFRHNLFYLQRVYQRHRAHRYPQSQHVVLDFDDVERCFGLRVLHSTFNYEIVLLIAGGVCILASRIVNVDPTPLGNQYEALLAALLATRLDSASAAVLTQFRIRDLFPDAGQAMLGVAWMVCFVIVALPSAVKFLPLVYKHVRLVGRREYLLEFLPPSSHVRLGTQEEVDALAAKFARSSFWPAGDERARTLYTIAYFVFWFVLVPVPPSAPGPLALHTLIVFVVSFLCMKLTFWVFKKALINVDATLAQA